MKITVVRDDLETQEEKQVEVDEEVNVKDVLEQIDVEPQEVLVSRDGVILTEKHEISEGDNLKVMDVIAGG